MKAQYFIGRDYFGAAEIPGHSDSIAYFCATCGDIWGRILVDKQVFQIRNVPCANHKRTGVPDWGSHPGSLLITPGVTSDMLGSMFWAAALNYLPERVLQREFQLHLSHVESN